MLNHKIQTTPNNCVSTCIAMITNEDVDTVTEKFHDRYRKDPKISVATYFQEIGLPHTVLPAIVRYTDEGGIFVLSVPSLNYEGGSHCILVHHHHNGDWDVYDPNKGRQDKKYYVNGPLDSDLAVQIVSYRPIVQILESDLSLWRLVKQRLVTCQPATTINIRVESEYCNLCGNVGKHECKPTGNQMPNNTLNDVQPWIDEMVRTHHNGTIKLECGCELMGGIWHPDRKYGVMQVGCQYHGSIFPKPL